MVSRGKVAIVSGNGWKPPLTQTRNGLRERVTEIGVLIAAAVARPPTGVHGEFHEVGEPPDLPGACRFTTRNIAKVIQIDGIGANGSQECVDEREVADLILGIVVNVLRHVAIQLLKGIDVGCTRRSSWNFAVWDSSEFVVLSPQIGFENFNCSQEPENCHISPCDPATSFFGEGRYPIGQQPGAEGSCSSYRKSFEQQGTAAGRISRPLRVFCHDIFFLRLLRMVFHDLLLIMAESI